MLLIDEEEEKKRREENIKRLFDTDDNEENTNELSVIERNNTYNQRMQNVKNLFEIDEEIEEPETQKEQEETKITPGMLVTNTNPSSDVIKPANEIEDENFKAEDKDDKSSGGLDVRGRSSRPSGSVPVANGRSNIVQDTQPFKTAHNNILNLRNNKEAVSPSELREMSDTELLLATDGAIDRRSTFQKAVDGVVGIINNFNEGINDVAPSIIDYFNATSTNAAKKNITKGLRFLGYSDAEIEKILPIAMENYNNWSPLSLLNSLLNNEVREQRRIENIQNNIILASGNPVTQKIAEIAPSIGNNVVPMAISAFNPILGTFVFITSAGGSYLDDARQRGMNDEQALSYATIMALFEGGTESIISARMLNNIGMAIIGKGLSTKVLESFGVSIGENFVQEAIMEPIQETVASIVGGPETADWDNMWQRIFESGVDGVLSAIILGGASVGVASAENVVVKKNPSQNDYNQALIDTINSGKVDVKSIVAGAQQAIIDSDGMLKFYAAQYDQDGNIQNIESVRGKEIQNPNENINIVPIIIKNSQNDAYNIIDKNTGLLLDSSPYQTLIEAQASFNTKMNNLDQAAIENVNNKIAQANRTINQEINQVATNIESERNAERITQQQNVINTAQITNENVMNDTQNGLNNVNVNQNTNINTNLNANTYTNNSNMNTDTYQTSQNQFTDDYISETTNYISQSENAITSQNNGLQEVQKLVSQISDNSIYNSERASQVFRTVARNIPNIELQVTENGASLNSLNENGEVVYSQKLSGKSYRGVKIKQIINNAISNADISNTNTTQANQNGFRDTFDNETANYMSQNENNKKGSSNLMRTPLEMEKSLNSLPSNDSITQRDELNQAIETFRQAKESVDRNVVLTIANSLNIKIKDGARKITDTEMSKKAGHNKKVKIVNITELFENVTNSNAKNYRSEAINEAMNRFRDKQVTIKDTKTIAEINKSGIEKTFSGSVTESKVQTADNLDNIIEEGLYAYSTQNLDSKDGIIYHDFFAPVQYQNNNGIIRIVIKEYTQNKTANNKFYYHQLEYINDKKIEGLGTLPRQAEVRNFKPAPSINTSISQNNSSVKNNTNANNYSMQNNENNTSQTNENGFSDVSNNETTSYMSQNESRNVEQNKGKYNLTRDSGLSFSEQVEKWKNGEINKNTQLVILNETPEIYRKLGAENLPITIVANKLERIYNLEGKQKGRYHGLGEMVKKLPEAIMNPLNIVKSSTKEGSIVIVTDLADNNDNIITVSLKLNGNGQLEVNNMNKNVNVNIVTSAYGRENYDRQKRKINGNYIGWMQQNADNNRIIYDIDEANKKRSTEGQRLELPNPNSKSSISNSIAPNSKDVNTVTNNYNTQNNENNTNNQGGNKNVEQEQSKRNTYDEQEISREQKTYDGEGTGANEQSNGSIKEELSVSLSNYAQEKSRQIGQNVKAQLIGTQNYTDYEKTISEGFIEATGLDINIYETDRGTSEGAFFSGNNIFLKHDSTASKKSTNFKPYHELGHWIRNNYNNEWNKLYNIIDNTITNEQIEQYKNVLNDKSVFDSMSNQEIKDYVINEIISDYLGNWSNNIKNWEDYILNGVISKKYADLLADISLENEVTGYNIFGSIEQQEQMYDEISRIMYNVISNRATNAIRDNTNNVVKYSDRADVIFDNDGKFNRVRINENIFSNNTNNQSISKVIHDYLVQHIGQYYYIIESGQKVYLGKDLPNEYAYSKSSQRLLITEKLAKGRAASGLQQIIENATNKQYKANYKNKHTTDGKYGFYKYDTRFSFIQNGKENIYKGTVLIRNDANGKKYLYDILDIKKVGSNLPPVASNSKKSSAIFGGSNSLPSNNSLAQNNISVKSNSTVTTNNNTQNNKNNTSKTKKSDRDMNENNQLQTEYDKKVQQDNRKIAKLIKERSFFSNVYNSSVPSEFKKTLLKHRQEYKYTPISNETTLENARQKVENIRNIRDEFMQNEIKSAEDTAVGELLIHKAIEEGNYEEANALTAALADKLTTAGQTIQAAAMFHRMTPEGMLLYAQRQTNNINKELEDKFKLNKLVTKKNAPQIELTEDKIEFIKSLTDQLQELEKVKEETTSGIAVESIERQQDILIGKIVAKIGEDIPVTMLDKLTAWRNISLLLNPKTIVRNVVSNTLFTTLENGVDYLGVPIDKLISLVTGQRSLLMPSLKTQAKGFKKGLEYAVEDTRMGISTSLGGNKYDIKPNKNFKNKYLQALETASYFGVEGMDRPFMQQAYDGALEMIMRLEGLTYGKDIPTTQMKEEALKIAQYRTFKDKNEVSEFLSKIKKSLNLGKSIGAADVIGLTYTNIPGNLTKKTIDYSPLGLYNVLKAYKQFKLNQMNGESTRQAQRELVQSISRTLIGSGIMAVSMQAFLAGVITASGDDEDDRIRELTGKENYAINVNALIRWITGGDTTPQNGDFYITYSNYEPLSAIMSAAAEMMGAAEQGENGGTIVYKGITTWINTIAELSTLSNFSNLFEFGDLGGSIVRSISQFPSSFIPTFLKQIAQFFEPASKSNYSDDYIEKNIINPMKQRIPWLNSTLESNYDTMGNEKKSFNGSTGLGRIYDVFLNTSYTSTVDMDSTEQEIYDLYISTGLTDHLPLTVKNSFTYKGEKITLTAKEKAQYQKELGERTAQAYKKRMQTKEYQNLTDEEKVKDLANILSDLQTEVRGEVVLEPRGLAYDATFTPSSSSLSYNGYKLNLTPDMQQEYEKMASDMYKKYENQELYNEVALETLKSKVKDAAKKKMFAKYRSKLVKSE